MAGKMRDNFSRYYREPLRKQRDRILIVCEDSKHSVDYFKAFCLYLDLSEKNVKIDGSCGSAPKSVFAFAEEILDKEFADPNISEDERYDCVYCVFDRDKHTSYSSTIENIKQNNKHEKISIIAITCVPCFELWILLHFTLSAKPMHQSELSKEIKKYIPNYKKEYYSELYHNHLKDKTDTAIKNAKILLKEMSAVGSDNPSTNLYCLIEKLLEESNK